jgi:hypothetical protein
MKIDMEFGVLTKETLKFVAFRNVTQCIFFNLIVTLSLWLCSVEWLGD